MSYRKVATINKKQQTALEAALASSLEDLVGRRITPELMEVVKSRVNARALIVEQLLENESDV